MEICYTVALYITLYKISVNNKINCILSLLECKQNLPAGSLTIRSCWYSVDLLFEQSLCCPPSAASDQDLHCLKIVQPFFSKNIQII